VQYGTQYIVPLNDVARLAKLPNLAVTTDGYEYNTSVNYFEFNLRRPALQDVRVRRAIAQAIDKDFLVKNVWFGYAKAATSPITDKQADFHSDDVPLYPYDPKQAEALLEEAGLKRGADGVRLRLTLDYSPSGDMYRQTADYVKQALATIGIQTTIRNQDNPTYLRRVWSEYDFDLNIYSASNIADPVIGIQRLFSSQAIQPGVPYSNGSGYASPAMDRLLAAGQIEKDPAARHAIYGDMQRLAMTDLPSFALVYSRWITIHDKKVKGLNTTGLGPYENFAAVYKEK
jgi:peptide/nickel transport system substrate-binding protein